MSSDSTSSVRYVIAVDDETVMRDLITQYLTRAGFTVVPCAHGVEMWAALAQYPARVVILDIDMPGEDGLSLAEQLRARHAFGLSILMLTGESGDAARAIAYGVGADDFLTKPCDWQRLVAMVTHLSAASFAA